MMKAEWILLLIVSTASAFTLHCPKIKCTSNVSVEIGHQCAAEEIGVFTLKKCKEDLMCQPISLSRDSVCVNITVHKHTLLAGQKCSANDECASNTCTDSVCVGKIVGADCTTTSECAEELFCHKQHCTKAEATCDAELRCETNSFCYIPQGEKTGKCYVYASIENGNPAPAAAACKSYYKSSNGSCTEGPKLKGDKKCPENNKCTYTLGDKEINTPCSCSKTDEGDAICPLGEGDSALFLSELSSFMMNKKRTPCHLYLGPFCTGTKEFKTMDLDFMKAYVTLHELNHPALRDASDCVNQLTNQHYQEAKKKVTNDSEEDRLGLYLFLGIAVGAVLVIAILLLIIYLKRKNSDEMNDGDQD